MIPEYQEPKGLSPDALAIDDSAHHSRRSAAAQAGSNALLAAMFRTQGWPKKSTAAKPARIVDICPCCGTPLRDKPSSIARIQAVVAAHYRIPLDGLKSDRRLRSLSHPRQMAMYLASELTPKSLPAIGRSFNRDHTTVIHAIKAVRDRIAKDTSIAEDEATLREALAA